MHEATHLDQVISYFDVTVQGARCYNPLDRVR